MTALDATTLAVDRQLKIPAWRTIERLTAGVMAASQYRLWLSEAWTMVREAYETEGGTERVAEAASWAHSLDRHVPSRSGDTMFPQHALRNIRELLGR